jgi:hypothetical protein
MSELGDATFALDDDGGRAKSVEDVGRDGLADDSAMSLIRKAQ